jgi:hypothetical protein
MQRQEVSHQYKQYPAYITQKELYFIRHRAYKCAYAAPTVMKSPWPNSRLSESRALSSLRILLTSDARSDSSCCCGVGKR